MANVNLKIGMLGFADDFMHKLADTFMKNDLIEISSITDNIKERGEVAARKYDVTYEPDVNRFIENPNVEAICVGTNVEFRKDVLLKIIDSKKPVLCLHPIAENIEETMEIVSTVKKQEAKFYVPLKLRCYERFHEIRELCINEGRKVGSIHVTYRIKKNGHIGILDNLGFYALDLVRWFTRLEIDNIYAEVGGNISNINDAENILMLMYLNNGGFASVEISYDDEEEIYLNVLHDDMFSQILPLKQSVLLKKSVKDTKYPWAISPQEYAASEFIGYVLNNAPINTSLNDVIVSTKILNAAIKSLNKGPISINKED